MSLSSAYLSYTLRKAGGFESIRGFTPLSNLQGW